MYIILRADRCHPAGVATSWDPELCLQPSTCLLIGLAQQSHGFNKSQAASCAKHGKETLATSRWGSDNANFTASGRMGTRPPSSLSVLRSSVMPARLDVQSPCILNTYWCKP